MKKAIVLLAILACSMLMAIPLAQVKASPNYPTNGVNYYGQEALKGCLINCTWTSSNGLEGYIFSTNATGSWKNNTYMPMTGTSNVSTTVFFHNDTPGNVDSVKFYANDSDGWNSTYTLNVPVNSITDTDPWLPKKSFIIELWKEFWITHGLSNQYYNIGQTYQGNNLYLFECGNTSGMRVLYDAQIHGDEDQGTTILWQLVNWLYGGSTVANKILNKLDILIIPVIDFDVDGSSTRSRANNDTSWTNGSLGVNINRNFEYKFTANQYPNTTDYSGPYALSEPETNVLRNVFGNYTPTFYVNVHSNYASHNWAMYFNMNDECSDSLTTEANSILNQRFNATAYEIAKTMNITSTMFTMQPTNFSVEGLSIGDAYMYYNIPCSWAIESCPAWYHNATSLSDITNVRVPNFKALIQAQASINEPIFEAKTNSTGYFYIPTPLVNSSTGASIQLQSLYSSTYLEADISGNNYSAYTNLGHIPDGTVDLKDLVCLSRAYNKYEGNVSWNYMADYHSVWKVVGLVELSKLSQSYHKSSSYSTTLSGVTFYFDNDISLDWSNNINGLLPIPSGATSFQVTQNGNSTGAFLFFYDYEPTFTLTVEYNNTAIHDSTALDPPISSPCEGIHIILYGEQIECSTSQTIAIIQGGGGQGILFVLTSTIKPMSITESYNCTGWTGNGSVPSSGNTNSFQIDNIWENSTVTWNYVYTG